MRAYHHIEKDKRTGSLHDCSRLASNRTEKAGELFFVAQGEVYYEDQQLMRMNRKTRPLTRLSHNGYDPSL